MVSANVFLMKGLKEEHSREGTKAVQDWEDVGAKEFIRLPEIGEHLKVERDGKSHRYKVTAVEHDLSKLGCNVFAQPIVPKEPARAGVM